MSLWTQIKERDAMTCDLMLLPFFLVWIVYMVLFQMGQRRWQASRLHAWLRAWT